MRTDLEQTRPRPVGSQAEWAGRRESSCVMPSGRPDWSNLISRSSVLSVLRLSSVFSAVSAASPQEIIEPPRVPPETPIRAYRGQRGGSIKRARAWRLAHLERPLAALHIGPRSAGWPREEPQKGCQMQAALLFTLGPPMTRDPWPATQKAGANHLARLYARACGRILQARRNFTRC